MWNCFTSIPGLGLRVVPAERKLSRLCHEEGEGETREGLFGESAKTDPISTLRVWPRSQRVKERSHLLVLLLLLSERFLHGLEWVAMEKRGQKGSVQVAFVHLVLLYFGGGCCGSRSHVSATFKRSRESFCGCMVVSCCGVLLVITSMKSGM